MRIVQYLQGCHTPEAGKQTSWIPKVKTSLGKIVSTESQLAAPRHRLGGNEGNASQERIQSY
jgi:hypothetical protein